MHRTSVAAPDSAVRLAGELRVVFGRLRRRLREVADTGDLTPSQMAVLSRVDKGEAASASELAAAERVRPQSMAATLAALEHAGLIRRSPDPQDGRRQLIALTAAGRGRVEGNRQAAQEWLAQALRLRYTESERRTMAAAMALLDRLNQP